MVEPDNAEALLALAKAAEVEVGEDGRASTIDTKLMVRLGQQWCCYCCIGLDCSACPTSESRLLGPFDPRCCGYRATGGARIAAKHVCVQACSLPLVWFPR